MRTTITQICDALLPASYVSAHHTNSSRTGTSVLAPEDALEKVLDLAALLYQGGGGGGSLLTDALNDGDSSNSDLLVAGGDVNNNVIGSGDYAGVPVLALLLEGCLWPCFGQVAFGGGSSSSSRESKSTNTVDAELGIAVALAALGPASRIAALVACLHLDSAHAVLQVYFSGLVFVVSTLIRTCA